MIFAPIVFVGAALYILLVSGTILEADRNRWGVNPSRTSGDVAETILYPSLKTTKASTAL